MKRDGERFVFANQLRALAALCVVGIHLTGVYWTAPQLVADATFSAPHTGPWPFFAPWLSTPWLNLGPFGVALFFLISGFVIAEVSSIDFVNWTLIVEIKFYVLMALLIGAVRRGSLIVLFAVAACILAVSTFSHEIFVLIPALLSTLRIFENTSLYVLFMLIGVVFRYHARGLFGAKRLVASALALFAAFAICWPLTFFRGEYPLAPINYGYAAIVFGVTYALRAYARPARVLDFFAAVSYPLYLVHFLVGLALLQLLIGRHVDVTLATLLAFGSAIALAAALRDAIELRSQRFGKAIASRLCFGGRAI
jgi:peptidoglycan/LPS O-acetylase OafA/YrhL